MDEQVINVVTEVYCESCRVLAAGDAAPQDGRCPKCGTDDVEVKGYMVDGEGEAVV